MIQSYFAVSAEMLELDRRVMAQITPRLAVIDAIKEENQLKMLRAFTDSRVAANHLTGSTGCLCTTAPATRSIPHG